VQVCLEAMGCHAGAGDRLILSAYNTLQALLMTPDRVSFVLATTTKREAVPIRRLEPSTACHHQHNIRGLRPPIHHGSKRWFVVHEP